MSRAQKRGEHLKGSAPAEQIQDRGSGEQHGKATELSTVNSKVLVDIANRESVLHRLNDLENEPFHVQLYSPWQKVKLKIHSHQL